MVVWTAGSDGDPEFAEIARTGANAVRIVWTVADGGAAELDRAIANALAQQLIPIPELHDATGNRSRIPAMVDYWVRADVVAVVRKHERNLIVNIANEAGDGNVSAAQFQSDYQSAVSRMRGAGYHVPLMLDAPQWGQNIDVLQTAGPALITPGGAGLVLATGGGHLRGAGPRRSPHVVHRDDGAGRGRAEHLAELGDVADRLVPCTW